MNYEEFLKRKEIVDHPSGFEVDQSRLNPNLFDWQKVLVRWALLRGRAAIFASTGLGKTIMQLEWANHVHRKTRKPVLILAPLAVAEQTKQEGERFGIESKVVRNQSEVYNGINITNYQKLHKILPDIFSGVVLDECFPPGTMIDTPNGEIDIAQIQKDDIILNAYGEDNVIAPIRRIVYEAIRIKTSEGKTFFSSKNHPFFTTRGFVIASQIRPYDQLVETTEAMRLLWEDHNSQTISGSQEAFLQSILSLEMANFKSGIQSQTIQRKGRNQNWESQKQLVKFRKSESNKRVRTIQKQKKGKWFWFVEATRIFIENLKRRMGFRTSSILLQNGSSKSRIKDSNRTRWPYSQLKKKKNFRQKERGKTGYSRVESVEVLEQGHPELEKYRDADGLIYFYDIEAKRHPSFSVNGMLVHNSSILKSFSGTIRNQIINSFCKTPYRLSCTATPAPNDYTELGNQAEFLGVMTHSEMKATFFINDTKDTGTWRLKGHVKDNMFWKWIASWGAVVNMPSDLGFDDTDFILPPLTYHEHIIPANGKGRRKGFFLQEVSDLNDRRKVRKETISERCDAAVDLINSTDDRWLVWCNLNDEGLLLTKLIDGAIEVAGRHDNETKRDRLLGFANGEIKRLVSKPEVAGWGMNFQIAHKAAFVGLNDSWESLFQATRRIWRFGQKEPVEIHIFIEEREGPVLRNIKRKDEQATEMALAMSFHMKDLVKREVFKATKEQDIYVPTEEMRLPVWI